MGLVTIFHWNGYSSLDEGACKNKSIEHYKLSSEALAGISAVEAILRELSNPLEVGEYIVEECYMILETDMGTFTEPYSIIESYMMSSGKRDYLCNLTVGNNVYGYSCYSDDFITGVYIACRALDPKAKKIRYTFSKVDANTKSKGVNPGDAVAWQKRV